VFPGSSRAARMATRPQSFQPANRPVAGNVVVPCSGGRCSAWRFDGRPDARDALRLSFLSSPPALEWVGDESGSEAGGSARPGSVFSSASGLVFFAAPGTQGTATSSLPRAFKLDPSITSSSNRVGVLAAGVDVGLAHLKGQRHQSIRIGWAPSVPNLGRPQETTVGWT